MKNRTIIGLALIAAVFVSCDKELFQSQNIVQDGYKYTFKITSEQPGTRAVLDGNTIQWEAGDAVGIYAGESSNVSGTVSSDRKYLEVVVATPIVAGDVVEAYYPYAAGATVATAVPVVIPTSQTVTGGVYDADAMPSAIKPLTVSPEMVSGSAKGNMEFFNLGSVVRFHVYSTDPGKTGSVKSVSFTSTTPFAGSATYDITGDPESTALLGLDASTVTTTLDTPAAVGSVRETTSAQAPMVIAPGNYKGTVTVTMADATTYIYDIVNPFSIERSALKPVGVDLARAKVTTIEGSGTSVDPYIVHDATGLAAKMAESGVHIKLGSNILLGDWTTIESFDGVLDGDGNSIGKLNKCLIKTFSNGTVENIRFVDVNIGNYQSDGNCKGIVAQTASNVTITGIAAYGTLSSATTGGNSDYSGVGGVVGRASGTTTISNCYIEVDIPIVGSNFSVGGILGILRDNDECTTISNCTYAGKITGEGNYTKIGGIFGRKTKDATGSTSVIRNCLVSGSITIAGTGSNMVGGVFGALQGGNVSGEYVGGLTIKQCAFTGQVSAGNAVGGIGGVCCSVRDCFVSGKVQGTNVTDSSTGGSAGIVSAAKGAIECCVVAGARISGNNGSGRATAGIVSKQNGNTPAVNNNAVVNIHVQEAGFAIMGSTANLTASNNKWWGVKYLDDSAYVPGDPVTVQDGAAFAAAPAQVDFESMGFDFTDVWKWNAAGYPELKNVGASIK